MSRLEGHTDVRTGKALELGKSFLASLSHKVLQERTATKQRFRYTGAFLFAQPTCGTQPLSFGPFGSFSHSLCAFLHVRTTDQILTCLTSNI